MKKTYVAAIAIALLSVTATGCKMAQSNTNSQSSSADNSTQVGNGELNVDSIFYNNTENTGLKCTITVDYPQGNDSLSLGVKAFITKELAALYLPLENAEDEAETSKYPIYSGNIDKGKQLVDYYGNGTMRYLTGIQEEMKKSYPANQEMPPITQEIRIRLKEITPTYITYCVTDEYYLGGAHRSYTSYFRNISKKTCKVAENLVDSTKILALQPLLRKHILKCLVASGISSVSDKTMGNYLILPDDGNIPLPVHTPWIQNDSLHFEYQPYEIASYAVGAISFSIAPKDIRPYLTGEATELLK